MALPYSTYLRKRFSAMGIRTISVDVCMSRLLQGLQKWAVEPRAPHNSSRSLAEPLNSEH